ncbi:unnamed protein product [Peronospora effusa]|nr:unnamed protein product [Peronospora effusa]
MVVCMYKRNDRGVDLQKQASVALLTREAVFVAGSLVPSKLLGMFELLDGVRIKMEAQVMLHIDNQAAIKQITGKDSSRRAKHIVVRHNFVKDYSKKSVIKVVYCKSRMMRADAPTKTFATPRLCKLRKKMSLV